MTSVAAMEQQHKSLIKNYEVKGGTMKQSSLFATFPDSSRIEWTQMLLVTSG